MIYTTKVAGIISNWTTIPAWASVSQRTREGTGCRPSAAHCTHCQAGTCLETSTYLASGIEGRAAEWACLHPHLEAKTDFVVAGSSFLAQGEDIRPADSLVLIRHSPWRAPPHHRHLPHGCDPSSRLTLQ
jgi:hypothetical protein